MSAEANNSMRVWDLGGIRYCPCLRELTVESEPIRLPPKPAAVLSMLIEAAPEPVSKDRLLDEIWPEPVVGDSAVADAVKYIRRVIGGAAARGEFIQTLHKHGYRLIPIPRAVNGETKWNPVRRPRWVAWALPVTALALGAYVLANQPAAETTATPQRAAQNPAYSEADIFYARAVQHYKRYRAQDNETAIDLFERVIELDPDYLRAYSGLGDAHAMQAHKYGGGYASADRGEQYARQAIALNPSDPTGHKALGLALSYSGRLEESASSYQQAILLANDYVAARVNLALIRIRQGRIDEAIPQLETALRIAPAGVINRLQLGHAYRVLGMEDLARAWYEVGTSLAPGTPADATSAMPFLLTRGEFDSARSLLEQTPATLRNDAHFQYWQGMLDLYQLNFETAERRFATAASHTIPEAELWIDAALRQAVAGHLAGRPLDPDQLNRIEDRVVERVHRGSEAWSEPMRMALLAICRNDGDALDRALLEAFDRGWLHMDELATDPTFADHLQRPAVADLQQRMMHRVSQLIAQVSDPPSAIAAN